MKYYLLGTEPKLVDLKTIVNKYFESFDGYTVKSLFMLEVDSSMNMTIKTEDKDRHITIKRVL